ncbi:hypothetical protein IN07_24135 [Modestobacter caceresii]|jgi:hypothetical protein|uniref:Uncharacterized protein n=1 Tax=Modestobacter caceresii TaxID=1522368 RepID=A0A098Y1M5_9ACTN|nr:hypothetical protein [Modestobacter caceresii]KGH43230.1 hypothetical protein IN07_24135 [Modestobacter caceresii]
MSAKPHLQSVTDQPTFGETGTPPAQPSTPAAPPAGGPPRGEGEGAGNRAALRQRAEKSLPTDRLSFEKQVEALKWIAQLSGPGKRPVTAEEISASLGLKGNTGGLSNKFFRDSGWIEPGGRGQYVATDGLVAFHRHFGMDSTDLVGAQAYLLGSARASWYWQEIEGMVQGAGVRTAAVLHALARAAGASANHKEQLELVVEWLEWLGLVSRDGEIIAANSLAAVSKSVSETEEQTSVPDAGELMLDDQTPVAEDHPDDIGEQSDGQATLAAPVNPVVDAAIVSMTFSVRITADDAVKLSDDQLKTLLAFAEKLRS